MLPKDQKRYRHGLLKIRKDGKSEQPKWMASEKTDVVSVFARRYSMNIAVIFAGGIGKRMNNNGIPKQFIKVYNKEILIYTLEHFQKHPQIDEIIIVMLKDYIERTKELVELYNISKVNRIVEGGSTGQESIFNGLVAANDISVSADDIVLIHDGVRPLINSQVITDNIESVRANGSAITVANVVETIVSTGSNHTINDVYERSVLKIARAPQSFFLADIYPTSRKAIEEKEAFIDSCSLMSHYGYKIYYVEGPSDNIKITTVEDYYSFRAIIQAKENIQVYEG